MSGKIALAYDNLSPKDWGLLTRIMYDVIHIDPKNIVTLDDEYDVILCIGEKSLNELCGLKGILRYAGIIQTMWRYPTVPVVHPGYLEHNPDYMTKFAEDILTAYHISIGLDKVESTNQYKIVEDLDTLKNLVQYCKQTGYCAFDFESSKLTDMGTFDPDFYVTTLSISFQQGSSYVIPLLHDDSPFRDSIHGVIELLEEIFSDPMITKIGHYVKFDMHCAAWLGIRSFRGPYHCTMLLSQLYDENMSHKLKDLVRSYFSRFANYEKAIGKDWASIPLNDLARYNALDSDLTLRLYWLFTDMLMEDPAIYLEYRNLTAPATKTLFNMEEVGMHVDKEYLMESIRKVDKMIEEQETLMKNHPEVVRYNAWAKDVAKDAYIVSLEDKLEEEKTKEYKSKSAQENKEIRIAKYQEEIKNLKTGSIDIDYPEVNFNSPAQLKELLFDKNGFGFDLPKQKFQKLATDSTGADNLDLIKDKTGFLEQLQIYRQLKKVSGTYLTSILNKLDRNHYIHTTFNQHIAITGRLSSNKPNLQNIITRTKFSQVEEAVKFVKKSFTPPKGYTLVAADYSQIELRVIAHYADEKNMLRIFQNNEDIHEMTAANSRGYTIEEFKKLKENDPKEYKKMRYEAKAENFGFVYGISVEGFREYARTDYGINISSREAENRRNAYFKKYPELLKYHSLYINKARKFKYVRTFFGRRVHLPEIDSINGGKKGHAERNAINSPIQGTAGEMTIFSLPMLENRLDPRILIVNSIHDADYFYVPNDILEETLPIIKDTMEHLPLLEYFGKTINTVPIKVDFEISEKSWGDLVG